jgi:vacuolar-type H+-ATPase subunit C/Vma6
MNDAKYSELLRRSESTGYPADYLLSRLRGRRASFISAWDCLLAASSPLEYLSSGRYGIPVADRTADGVWRHLMKEFGWVYSQMNETLRGVFFSFFLYSELRTIFICLRQAQGRKPEKIERLLSLSLLSEKIKRILRAGEEAAAILREIEPFFTGLSGRFAGIGRLIETEGLQGVERHMTDRHLEYAVRSAPHPSLRAFFSDIIDSRNVLSLYKYLRLSPKATPAFIRGGRVSEERFNGIVGRKDPLSITPLLHELTGTRPAVAAPSDVENALYRNITFHLRKAARDPLGIGVVLEYLWRCSLEARNLSILFHGAGTDRDILSAELIR